MRSFHKNDGWNKERDAKRRYLGEDILSKNGIKFHVTSPGHLKVETKKCVTLMFYPKSGKIVWKETREGKQHVFVNSDEGVIIRKLKELS